MRRSRPLLALLTLSACASETDLPGFAGGLDTGTAASSSSGVAGSTGSTSGLPTTTAGEGDPTGEDSSGGGSSPVTSLDPSDPSSSSSSSSGEPDTTTTTTTSTGTTGTTGEPDTGSSSTGPVSHCDNGVRDGDETDLDCGGAVCPACSLGAGCLLDLDCASSWCDAGVCAKPGCLVDADCDVFDEPCVESSCDALSKTCALEAVHDGQPCDGDGDLCTAGGVCDKGGCLGEQPVVCSDLDNACGTGACDPGTGVCVAIPAPGSEGQACDDGFVCTPNDTCVAGLCGVGGPGYLFFEDFADPAPGWELGPTWAIGPALASPDGYNGADPAADHSPGPDEALAGVAIGELVPPGAQTATCLSSPTIPAPGQGPLWLSFWRHLHTDYFPFVTHTVEAFDGEVWHELDIGYTHPGVDDPDWTFVEYDLGAHAGPALRVRVCYSQTVNAVPHAGWSLDDLTVGPYSCTPTP